MSQRVDQSLGIGRFDLIVVEVDERELGSHGVEKEVDVGDPSESRAVRVDLDAIVGPRVRPADLFGAVVRLVDRHDDTLRGIALIARTLQGPVDERLGLERGYAHRDDAVRSRHVVLEGLES